MPHDPQKWVKQVTKCAVTQETQKGRFWVRQVSLTVTSTTWQHGPAGTARSHLHTQRTHDGPSASYCSKKFPWGAKQHASAAAFRSHTVCANEALGLL